VPPAVPQAWLPRWIRRLGGPAWVVAPDRTLHWMNRPMRALLGDGTGWRGRPCWDVIRGRDARGRRHCSARCRPLSDVILDRPVHPALIAVGSDPVRWLHVLVVPLRGPDGSFPWLVHGAAACAGPRDARSPVHEAVARSLPARAGDRRARMDGLTPREREVVALLCGGATLRGIAATLGVRYVTVRNHVQHIEAKLGVHSLLEIVAFRLSGPEPGRGARRLPAPPRAAGDLPRRLRRR
jgi:DNA-binding CsgD family transcriptional regulator